MHEMSEIKQPIYVSIEIVRIAAAAAAAVHSIYVVTEGIRFSSGQKIGEGEQQQYTVLYVDSNVE